MGKRAVNETQRLLKALIYLGTNKNYKVVINSFSMSLVNDDKNKEITWKKYKKINECILNIFYDGGLTVVEFYVSTNKYNVKMDTHKLVDEAHFLINTQLMIW